MARIIGTASDDDMVAEPTGSILEGLGGRDVIYGREGDDALFGGNGNDVVHDSDGGADRLFGGAGRDLVEVFRFPTMRAAPVLLNGGADSDTIRISNSIGYQPALFEGVRVDGGSGNDQIFATGIAGVILGGSGDDLIAAQYSAVTIDAGTGNDVVSFYGQDEQDGIIAGGTGNDAVEATARNADLTVTAGDGNDRVTLSIQQGTHQARVDLGAGNDRVTAYGLTSDVFVSVLGGAGDDTMSAFGFAVEARGGSGSDRIEVEATSAVIDAGSGRDVVTIGSEGDYSVVLGDGPDRLEIDALFTNSPDTFDFIIVTDFRTGNSGDVLDLSESLAKVGWKADQGDPFDLGYVRLQPFSADPAVFSSTFVEMSFGDGEWFIQALLIGVAPGSLNDYNLDGIGG